MQLQLHRSDSIRGFTLVELVVVLVILGIIAAVAGPRFFNDKPFLERAYYEELAAALRYSQKLAVTTGCPVRVAIGASGYAASQQRAAAGRCDPADTSWSTPVLLPDGQPLAGTSPDGVSTSGAVTMTFDSLGRTDLGADRTIAVGAFSLVVRADSGYVQMP
jgi:MSHA pilin protein MshC